VKSKRRIHATCFIAATVAVGCMHRATLRINSREPLDRTALGGPPQRSIRSLMILPPAGSERGRATALAEIEPFLLAANFQVISSGVTARVVQDQSGNRVEPAANLSDLERALILAKDSGADVLFQVLEIGWVKGRRVFVREGHMFREVHSGEPKDTSPGTAHVQDAEFRIRGRIIDVESAAILAFVDVAQRCSDVEPSRRDLEVRRKWQRIELRADTPEKRTAAVSQAMAQFLRRMKGLSQDAERAAPLPASPPEQQFGADPSAPPPAVPASGPQP
jgi:hypothetical protein